MIRREIDKEGNKASDHVERSAFFCTGTYYGSMRDIGAYALIIQANELALWGIYAASAEAQITIPADMDKSRINSIRNHLKRAVKRLSEEGFLIEELKIQGGIQTAVKVPAVRVTAAGCERTKRLQNACLTARARLLRQPPKSRSGYPACGMDRYRRNASDCRGEGAGIEREIYPILYPADQGLRR